MGLYVWRAHLSRAELTLPQAQPGLACEQTEQSPVLSALRPGSEPFPVEIIAAPDDDSAKVQVYGEGVRIGQIVEQQPALLRLLLRTGPPGSRFRATARVSLPSLSADVHSDRSTESGSSEDRFRNAALRAMIPRPELLEKWLRAGPGERRLINLSTPAEHAVVLEGRTAAQDALRALAEAKGFYTGKGTVNILHESDRERPGVPLLGFAVKGKLVGTLVARASEAEEPIFAAVAQGKISAVRVDVEQDPVGDHSYYATARLLLR